MKTFVEINEEAKKLYYEITGNDPVVHCNRFPTWEELTEKTRQAWRNKIEGWSTSQDDESTTLRKQ